MVEPLAKKRKTEKRKWFAPDEVFLKVWGETIVPETNRRQQGVQDSLKKELDAAGDETRDFRLELDGVLLSMSSTVMR